MPAAPITKSASAEAASPLAVRLTTAIANWSTSQRAVVDLAATFADSHEWAAAGSPTAAHWIATVADIEVCTAREWIRIGRQLRSLPLIAGAFDRDDLSYSKVRALTRMATPDNEQELLVLAATVSAGQLPRALAAWVGRNSEAEELERYQHEQRSASWRSEPDGMVTFSARLPPLVAGVLIARLTTGVMTTTRTVQPFEEWPTLAQQHADAFEQLLSNGGGHVVTELILHVRGDGCTLDDGTPIPGSVVERIASEALIRLLIHDAQGRPVNASHRRRHPNDRQKRVVKERDRVCVDCDSNQLLQYDHNPEYEATRHTIVEELELRCAPCHARRHKAA